jgi:hypothetical protein
MVREALEQDGHMLEWYITFAAEIKSRVYSCGLVVPLKESDIKF